MKNELNADQLKQLVTVTIPLSAVLRLAETEPPAGPSFVISGRELPAIGAPFKDGIFAGITVDGLVPMALVLLPGDEEKNWKAADAWAEEKGGALPSRMDALVLWQNLPKEFQQIWYWTSEEHASNADCAWIQYFSGGNQGSGRKGDGFRCRAVRRVAI